MTELLTHCAAYLASPLLVEPLLDRFMEESDEFGPAAEDYCALMRGGRSNGAIYLLVDDTTYTATSRRHVLVSGVEQWEREAIVIVGPADDKTVGVDSRRPTFYGLLKGETTLDWFVVRYTPVSGAGRPRPHFRALKPRPVATDLVVKELFDAGGLGNVLHAVLGVHYFAVPPYETAHKAQRIEPCPT